MLEICRSRMTYDEMFEADGSEWHRIETGSIQRVRALNLFIDDVSRDQRITKNQVVPEELVASSTTLLAAGQGFRPPGRIWCHITDVEVPAAVLLTLGIHNSAYFEHSFLAQQVGRLRSEMDDTGIPDIIETGLHEYIDQFQGRLNDLGEAIFDEFFAVKPVAQVSVVSPAVQ